MRFSERSRAFNIALHEYRGDFFNARRRASDVIIHAWRTCDYSTLTRLAALRNPAIRVPGLPVAAPTLYLDGSTRR